jgi:hypothetical protein
VIEVLSLSKKQKEMASRPNHLINEQSLYLHQHAWNPVDWHPWNEATLHKAKTLNKPLLISIGYASCHWCHVMAHETFEDEKMAQIMNRYFVCIKVDREELPDVDHLYMDAVQLLTRSGGWPLHAFAFPDGRPFYGGTYFRKSQWKELLEQINSLFIHQKQTLELQARNLSQGIRQANLFLSEKQSYQEVDVSGFAGNIMQMQDEKHGGLQGAPKFAMPSLFHSLLIYSVLREDKKAFEAVERSLNGMSHGGIYDQIGGGFSRYCVDAAWKIPHFEKMLYDNALLLSLYSYACRYQPRPEWKKVVYETFAFVRREMTSPEGVFYSALDADSEGEEGKFYVWEKEAFKKVTQPYHKLMQEYFGIDGPGLWKVGKNILLRPAEDSVFAKKNNLSETELQALVKSMKAKLLKERHKRVSPGTDHKIIMAWNAMMIVALTDAYKTFHEHDFLWSALTAAHFINTHMKSDEGALQRIYSKKAQKRIGFLDDYAWSIKAQIQLFDVTQDESWLLSARRTADYVISNFFSEETKLFYYSAHHHTIPVTRKTEIHDHVMPSSNAVMIESLQWLSILFESERYRTIVTVALEKIVSQMYQGIQSYGAWFSLLQQKQTGYYTVLISGSAAQENKRQIDKTFRPNVMALIAQKESQLPIMQDKIVGKENRLQVCTETTCLMPVQTVEEALSFMK